MEDHKQLINTSSMKKADSSLLLKGSFTRPFTSKNVSNHQIGFSKVDQGQGTSYIYEVAEPKSKRTKPLLTFMPLFGYGIDHYRRQSVWKDQGRKRLIHKTGQCNITQINVSKQRRQYLADIFTTLVDIRWRYVLVIFSMGFTLSWLIFALIWWLICFAHGDFAHRNDSDWMPCVKEVYDFPSAFLFSVESQHTIGYGLRVITETCPEAVIVLCLQSMTGVIIGSFMVGIVYSKLSRPKKRAETLMFSKKAVICQRDEKLCLLFRVGDMRKSFIINAHVRVQLIKKKVMKEGEVVPFHLFDVNIGFNTGADRIFLFWPLCICHEIDESSPFWEMTPEDFAHERFELIVILEGVVESTSMTTQARTSYLPHEILWGHRLYPLVTYQKENGQYEVDYSHFHATYPVETPMCSAKELHDKKTGLLIQSRSLRSIRSNPSRLSIIHFNKMSDEDDNESDYSDSSFGSIPETVTIGIQTD